MIERFLHATEADNDRYIADFNAEHLAKRQAYELANMSRYIRPEHRAMCTTQTMIGKHGPLECDTPPEYLKDFDRKPVNAVRIAVAIAEDGSETKAVIASDPRDVLVAVEEAGAIK